MKHWILACAAIVAGFGFAQPLLAGGEQVSVPFSDVKTIQNKKGETLDGSVKFVFADEKDHGRGEVVTFHGAAGGPSHDLNLKCKKALFDAFLKLQKKAQAEGKTRVVDITTASAADDPASTSGSRNNCLCSANFFKATTLVKGTLAP